MPGAVTVSPKVCRRPPGDRHVADQAVTPPTKSPISVLFTMKPSTAIQTTVNNPARSMLSFQLFLTEQSRAGAEPERHPTRRVHRPSTATGSTFAASASTPLLAANRHDTTNHLTRALETNREIGVVTGILMANGKLTSQEAFDQLRTARQNLNR